jgi:regulatory protein
MGRAAVARTIAQRGIERSVIDEVLDSEPNDDAQRALDFARKKAASLGYLDREVAVRRLAGQLARRGFSASALSVASRAVDEARKPAGGVRFS